ncbi:MAG TPA: hypothetical protein VGE27_17000 [Gemmatimonas sp.]|uniref:hypothetical protein n=1 Tax=Gemmatimonas sp. TaxID=1962908 RepID=UPI002ED8D676
MPISKRTGRTLRPVLALLALSACTTDSLNVSNPDLITPESQQSAAGAQVIRNGAVQDFYSSYSGTQDGVIMMSGAMADEIEVTDTFADRQRANERATDPTLGGAQNTLYQGLHKARVGLSNATKFWSEFKATSKDSLAEIYSLKGFSENFFAELYCAGVPFSYENAGQPVYGMPQTTVQMLNAAAASFDTALTNATSANQRALASIGKARVLLNLGQFTQAAAAVSGIATSFSYRTYHTTSRTAQQNGIWTGTVPAGTRYTVSTNEGGNGYNFLQTPADPRMPWLPSTRTGFDGRTTNMPTQQKYPANNSSAVLADGVEARLIELEAQLRLDTQAGRDAVFAGLNNLRATAITPAMAALAGSAPTTQAAAVDQFFRERASWLWLTGHRLGDMRRLIRQYGRAANTVFPVGTVRTRPEVTYGTDVNFTIPFRETNNPNFSGCLDRNP